MSKHLSYEEEKKTYKLDCGACKQRCFCKIRDEYHCLVDKYKINSISRLDIDIYLGGKCDIFIKDEA